jgi:hypothetical protein
MSQEEKAEEIVCRECFLAYLRDKHGPENVEDPERPPSDPPDYYFTVKGIRYAVEATSIWEHIEKESKSHPMRTFVTAHSNLARTVEKEARSKGVLRGGYLISVSDVMVNLGGCGNILKSKLLDYVESTRDMDSAPEKIVWSDRFGCALCSITKVRSKKDEITIASTLPGVNMAGVPRDACRLLEERIREKTGKLSEVPAPKVLLIYHAYGLVDSSCYRECVMENGLLESLAAIFVVDSATSGYILHSSDTYEI